MINKITENTGNIEITVTCDVYDVDVQCTLSYDIGTGRIAPIWFSPIVTHSPISSFSLPTNLNVGELRSIFETEYEKNGNYLFA